MPSAIRHEINTLDHPVPTGERWPLPTRLIDSGGDELDFASDGTIGLTRPTVLAATGTRTTAGTTTAVAAPGAGFALRLHHLAAIAAPDAANFPVLIFRGSGGSEIERGFAIGITPRLYLLDLPENEALEFVTDAAAQVEFTVHYTIESST